MTAERFRTTITGSPLPSAYPAEIAAGRDGKGAVRPWFSRDIVERIVADLRSLSDAAPYALRLTDDALDVLTPGEPAQLIEHVAADRDGKFPVGHGYWGWSEYTDRETAGFTAALSAAAGAGYAETGPDEWTVAVADHGDWCAVLAIYPTPAQSETALREELYFELDAAGLASFEVAAPGPAEAELATRRWFAADRAEVDPDATCKPLAFPETRIPGPNGP